MCVYYIQAVFSPILAELKGSVLEHIHLGFTRLC